MRSPKYRPLGDYLRGSTSDRVTLTFDQIEAILRDPLPPSARRHDAYWANSGRTHVWAVEWMAAGWRVESHSLTGEWVTFVRAG